MATSPPDGHVYLQRLHGRASIPARATEGSFGYDLATVQRERIGPHETRIVPCGFKLARDLLRDRTGGLAMLVLPRSSLPLEALGAGPAAAVAPLASLAQWPIETAILHCLAHVRGLDPRGTS